MAPGAQALHGGSGWLPSCTGSLCHCSLTKVPHLQRAQEGWRRRAVTVVPATTKLVARGDATAARLSSGPAVSCARRADTDQTAEVRGKLWGGSNAEGLCGGGCSTRCYLERGEVGAGPTFAAYSMGISTATYASVPTALRSDLWGWGHPSLGSWPDSR